MGIAEGKVAVAGQALVSYALGSCVGVCLYDQRKRIAGMAHIVLPQQHLGTDKKSLYKFADTGICALVREMARYGADSHRLRAKIAGGARMFQTEGLGWDIGSKNVEAVKKYLEKEGIPLVGEETGKNFGRTLWFYAEDGTLEIKSVRHKLLIL